jgi:hypothetical protein
VNAVVTAVDSVPPDVTVTVDGAPAVFVSVKSTWPAPELRRAVTRYVPAVAFAVAVTLASPPLSVVAVVALSVADAPLDGAVYVMPALGTTLPNASSTTTPSAAANAVFTVALCVPAPAAAWIEAAAPGAFVREKLAGVVTPVTEAVTEKAPATVLAVAVTLALPVASVVAVVALSVADAPLVGAANVTVAPETGLPSTSVTSAISEALNAVVTAVVCELPPATAIADAAPASFNRLNDTGVDTPLADAVTLYGPAVPLAVAVTLTCPAALVVPVVALSVADAPVEGGPNVTPTPETGFP